MKRSRDFSGDDNCDDDFLPARPAKRFSMMDNTPQQLKEERRHILKLSKQKLKKIDNPLRDLQKSVLINNTTRRMKRELQEHGGNKYSGYKRNHAYIPYQRTSLSRKSRSWETEIVPKSALVAEKCEDAPSVNMDTKCDVTSKQDDVDNGADFRAMRDTVLNHIMDMSSSSASCENCKDCESRTDSGSCDSRAPAMDMNRNFRSQLPDNSEHCENDRIMSVELSGGESSRIDCHHTHGVTSDNAQFANTQSVANECNYSAQDSQSHDALNMDTSASHSHNASSMDSTVQSATLGLTDTTTNLFTSYSVLYKHYSAYAGYLHSLQHPYGSHNQFLFTLAELMHNNSSHFGSAFYECSSRHAINSSHSLNAQCSAFANDVCEQTDNEETYVDILT